MANVEPTYTIEPSSSSSSLSDIRTINDPNLNGILCCPSPYTSSSSTLSIKFAPLPDIAPRKRRSHAPLGVSSRANMMRRQHLRRQEEPNYSESTTRVDSDGNEVVVRYENTKSPSVEDDDPFVVLGRAVKGATKSLWRKVSSSADNKKTNNSSSAHVVATLPREEQLSLSSDGVWEEEVDERFQNIAREAATPGECTYPPQDTVIPSSEPLSAHPPHDLLPLLLPSILIDDVERPDNENDPIGHPTDPDMQTPSSPSSSRYATPTETIPPHSLLATQADSNPS